MWPLHLGVHHPGLALPLSLAFLFAAATFGFSPSNSNQQEQFVTVSTSVGRVRGQVLSVGDGPTLVDQFLGVPNAQPPVGELRFEKPVALAETPLRHIDATEQPKMCVPTQMDDTNGTLQDWDWDYSEDCLYINVLRQHNQRNVGRRSLVRDTAPPKPVLVLICVGGFQYGSMRRFANVEEMWRKFVSKGILVFAIQFRIGFLGFSSSGDAQMPGNFAYWDMTAALRWIRKNARNFGGDPDKITLFGYSSAATSVATLALSPHSAELFHQAIQFSGPIFTVRAASDRVVSSTRRLAVELDCALADSAALKQCLKERPIEQMVAAMGRVGSTLPDYNYVLFQPRLDHDFIPAEFAELVKTAKPKPTILGTTKMDPLGFATFLGNNSLRQLAIPREEWATFNTAKFKSYVLQKALKREYFGERAEQIAQKVVDFYTQPAADREGDNWFFLERTAQFLTDVQFTIPMEMEVKAKLERGWPLFFYANNFVNDRQLPPGFQIKKNFHANDFMYVMRNPKSSYVFDQSDERMEELMAEMIDNFVINGFGGVKWVPVSADRPFQHMEIDLPPKLKVQREMDLRAADFWANMTQQFPEYDLILGKRGEGHSANSTVRKSEALGLCSLATIVLTFAFFFFVH